MNFKKEIKKIEEIAETLAEKEPTILDINLNQKINQIRAHIHHAHILLKDLQNINV